MLKRISNSLGKSLVPLVVENVKGVKFDELVQVRMDSGEVRSRAGFRSQ